MAGFFALLACFLAQEGYFLRERGTPFPLVYPWMFNPGVKSVKLSTPLGVLTSTCATLSGRTVIPGS